MRDRIVDALGDLAHSRFLVYLMGPYKAFDIEAVLEATETDESLDLSRIPENVDFGTLVGSDTDLNTKKPCSTCCSMFVTDSEPTPV